MEENNNSKRLNWIIITITVLVLGIVGYIVYDNFLKVDKTVPNYNNSTTTTTTSTTPASSTRDKNLPSDLSDYNLLVWNYEEIYNYYFKMNDDDQKINLDSSFKDVKIENNKLYWNIDNKWVNDKNIVDDIKYFYMNISPLNSEYFIVVTETNKIYYITFEDVCFYCEEADTYVSLTSELYNKFKYNEINVSGKINKISAKLFAECEAWNNYYFDIENKIFVLNGLELKLEDLNSFMAQNTITSLDNTCSANYILPLTIELDGTIKGIIDENNNLIEVKYYILLEKAENDYYDIIIDKNNNLYIIDRESNQQKIYDKVLNFKYNKDDYGNEKLNIDLEKNKNITKEIIRN